jgi:hypothetical protein
MRVEIRRALPHTFYELVSGNCASACLNQLNPAVIGSNGWE